MDPTRARRHPADTTTVGSCVQIALAYLDRAARCHREARPDHTAACDECQQLAACQAALDRAAALWLATLPPLPGVRRL